MILESLLASSASLKYYALDNQTKEINIANMNKIYSLKKKSKMIKKKLY